ncbi:hypothetical protein [Stutzerimonas nitrititolerans]|uniref:hypothetical protein n=1 Tax=Stutzerimonas nitrititolerans TaxID=2482751 RepID=UPI0028ABC4C8|nr:hypothetical protein [Stutzerimonas nitrititolerans]
MEECPNRKVFDSLSSSFDRIDEAAWFIRLMEENYHSANKFRWSLNSFLRTLKEIMQLVSMEVQGSKELSKLVAAKKSELSNDPLIAFLYKQRDIVVHKEMLKPASRGSVGFTRGRGMKLGLDLPIDPLSDSREAIKKYIYFAAKDTDFMGILYTEEDGGGEYTCVQRQWRLSQFPETEITELAASAWEKVAQAFFDVAGEMGAKLIKPTFKLGNPNQVQFEIYNPEWVKEQLEDFKKLIAKNGA